MRVQAAFVIEVSEEYAVAFAAEHGLLLPDGRYRARDVVEHVRALALSDLRHGDLGEHADISIKGR